MVLCISPFSSSFGFAFCCFGRQSVARVMISTLPLRCGGETSRGEKNEPYDVTAMSLECFLGFVLDFFEKQNTQFKGV